MHMFIAYGGSRTIAIWVKKDIKVNHASALLTYFKVLRNSLNLPYSRGRESPECNEMSSKSWEALKVMGGP